MTRKKDKKPPILNNLEEDNIVEKSRPLLLMREVPFALGELKVLDTYLSRINARDSESTTVRFSKEEYEDLMGIERMRPDRLAKYVKSIMSKVVTVPDPEKKGAWKQYTLFDESSCEQDENGQWWIDLSCTTKAKKLFFNVDGIGYIRYQLKNVLPLTSKYSVLLYIYLLDNRFRRSWDIDLSDLREHVFRCNSEFYAKNYRNFKQDILDKALKEVNDKTDLTFKFNPLKYRKKVTKIKFMLVKDEVTLPPEDDPNQLSFNLDDTDDDLDYEAYSKKYPDMFYELNDIYKLGLTPDQIEVIKFEARNHAPLSINQDSDVCAYDYIIEKVKLMNTQKDPVEYKFGWLKKAIINDFK